MSTILNESAVTPDAPAQPGTPVAKTSVWVKLIDLAERAGATFAQSFLATITVQRGVNEKTALYTAAVAGAYALAKYLLTAANAYLRTPSA